MVEGLTEAVGVVAKVGVESVGQGVAFCLEQKADTVVLGKGLIDDGCGAVGRNEQSEEWRFFGLDGQSVLAVDDKGGLGGFVLFHLLAVLVAKRGVQWRGKVATEREPTFASGGAGGDIEEEIGEDFSAIINAVDIRHTGRKDGERAEDEDVGIDIGNGIGDDALHDGRELVADGLGKRGKWY